MSQLLARVASLAFTKAPLAAGTCPAVHVPACTHTLRRAALRLNSTAILSLSEMQHVVKCKSGNCIIVDVRNPEEYKEGFIPGAGRGHCLMLDCA